ncbi:MAG: hypothetical protein EZS28_025078 [Streblomastix strix]|uniref:Uncharacterized protein n=1 Tax=Streblomastix strix TaxID=222440 RepID=A0A5J4VA44_9EUKA|nr:MAG: hypothetical protein EZS28_025078 [Streblomastix strix]
MSTRSVRGPVYPEEDMARWRTQALALPAHEQERILRKAGYADPELDEDLNDYAQRLATIMEDRRLREISETQPHPILGAEESENSAVNESEELLLQAHQMEQPQLPLPTQTTDIQQGSRNNRGAQIRNRIIAENAENTGNTNFETDSEIIQQLLSSPEYIRKTTAKKRSHQKGRSLKSKKSRNEKRKLKKKEKKPLIKKDSSTDSDITSSSEVSTTDESSESETGHKNKKPRMENLPDEVRMEAEKIQKQKKDSENADLVMRDIIESTFETNRKDFDPEQWLPKEGIEKEAASNTWDHERVIAISKPKAKSIRERGQLWAQANHTSIAAEAASLNVLRAFIQNQPLLELMKKNVRISQTNVTVQQKLRDQQNVEPWEKGIAVGSLPGTEVISDQVNRRIKESKKQKLKKNFSQQRSTTPNPSPTVTPPPATYERAGSSSYRRGSFKYNK